MNINRWLNHEFSSGSCTGEDYEKFQREAKRNLTAILKENGLSMVKFNKNHYCFSVVVRNEESKFAYISISDVRWSKEWYDHVLYRTMKHDHDWSGGCNNYCRWTDLGTNIKRLLDRTA